jgi:hypothetical protein
VRRARWHLPCREKANVGFPVFHAQGACAEAHRVLWSNYPLGVRSGSVVATRENIALRDCPYFPSCSYLF